MRASPRRVPTLCRSSPRAPALRRSTRTRASSAAALCTRAIVPSREPPSTTRISPTSGPAASSPARHSPTRCASSSTGTITLIEPAGGAVAAAVMRVALHAARDSPNHRGAQHTENQRARNVERASQAAYRPAPRGPSCAAVLAAARAGGIALSNAADNDGRGGRGVGCAQTVLWIR